MKNFRLDLFDSRKPIAERERMLGMTADDLYREALEHECCITEGGGIRREWKHRPDLYLLAMLVRAIYSLARELYYTRHRV